MDPDPLSCLTAIICTIPQSAVEIYTPTAGSIIAIICGCLALVSSAFASASEIAFFSLTPQQEEDIEENPDNKKAVNLIKQPEKLLATILILNNLVNILVVTLFSFAINQIFKFNSDVLSFIIQSVILTFIILLFGEILPKLYATGHNRSFAIFSSGILHPLSRLFSPLSKILMKSTYIVNKITSTHGDELSTEDLSQALEITDVKAGDEKELLEGILKFGDKTVTEIMSPRVDIEDISYDSDFDKVVDIIIETGYSRLPVYDGNADNIKGILYAKDLLQYIGKAEKNFNWQRLLRPAYFVPETRMIDDLLEDFRLKKIHMAIVVDEFGCTQGIVTLEDVLEEIVGDINDEYDTEESFYKKLPDNSYIFDGKTILHDFFKVTGIDEDEFEDVTEDAETIAGLLLEIKGDFPKAKETINYKNCQFLVLEVEKHRISSVKVKILENGNEAQA